MPRGTEVASDLLQREARDGRAKGRTRRREARAGCAAGDGQLWNSSNEYTFEVERVEMTIAEVEALPEFDG